MNCLSAKRRFIKVASVSILMAASSGCMPSLRGTLLTADEHTFLAASKEFLSRMAYSDDPVLRMHAIEAYQDIGGQDGLQYLEGNLENGYAGVRFASLMALGTLRADQFLDRIRTRAEDPDASVRIAAIFALHRLGHQERTGELSEYLLSNRDPRVRANAALAVGRLGDAKSVRLLRLALHREKKDFVKMQILEALALLGDQNATERLIFAGHSAAPDQTTPALMFLANANSSDAEELFRYRLQFADYPEIKLEAARGLGRLGYDQGLDFALAYLWFRKAEKDRKNDPPEQQIDRVRQLAALALEAIGSPEALDSLRKAFDAPGQSNYVKLAIARAAIVIIERKQGRAPPERPVRSPSEAKMSRTN